MQNMAYKVGLFTETVSYYWAGKLNIPLHNKIIINKWLSLVRLLNESWRMREINMLLLLTPLSA